MGSVCSFCCCLCLRVKRFRLARRSWSMRCASVVDVLFKLVAVEFELVALEVGLVAEGGCSCGSRLLVKRPFWNRLGLSRHFLGLGSRGGSF